MSATEPEPNGHPDVPGTGHAAHANGPPLAIPKVLVDADTLPGLIRQVRRRAGFSQRELADAAGISHSTVARLESGRLAPSLATLLRLLATVQLVLVVTDGSGKVVQPLRIWDDTLDGAQRTFPAHLDLILDPTSGEWWGDTYGLARPPETFHRSRSRRDAKRRRSQWETRVAQFRHDPPPPRA